MPSKIGSQIISNWLDESLTKADVNQSELGRAIGLSSQQVNRILKGKREMTAEEMIRASGFLKSQIPALPEPGAPVPSAETPASTIADFDFEASGDDADRLYEIAFKTALAIEREEHDGQMPLKAFISAVAVGYRNLLRNNDRTNL